MQTLTMPENSPAQAAFIMDGDYMAPYIRAGAVVTVEWALPEVGQCGLFHHEGQTLVRQYCEDSFGNIYLFALNRDFRTLDMTIPTGEKLLCFGRLLLEKTPPLPLNG